MTTPPILDPISLPKLAEEMGISSAYLRDFMVDITPEFQRPGKGHRWIFTRETADTIKQLFANR